MKQRKGLGVNEATFITDLGECAKMHHVATHVNSSCVGEW